MTEYFQIELTQNQVARVSAEDFDDLCKFTWYAKWSVGMNSYYACRNSSRLHGKHTSILMHRLIMGNPVGMDVDHISGDILDNRRANLRICTTAENVRNQRMKRNNISGLKGASWNIATQSWRSQIMVDGRQIYLGLFATREQAHKAYCDGAKRYHGDFARLG